MKRLQIFTILILFLTFSACTSNSENETDPPGGTDPKDVSYEVHIKPIMTSKCTSCHKDPPINNAPMSLLTYQNVKDAVNNSGLINQVESGDMPPAGSDLSDAQVQLIKDWQKGGFKEK